MASKTYEKPLVDDSDDDSLQAQIAALQEQVAALIRSQTSGGGLSESTLERVLSKVAETTAQAQERAANPSNKTHPGISVYSYPEGDRARPRELHCPMTWAGFDLGTDTTTAEEIELLNLATPGVYKFARTDHTPSHPSLGILTVTGERDAGDALMKLAFTFPVEEQRDTLPGIAAMLRSAFRVPTPQERELAEMKAQLEALKAERAVPA
jgi:hypothetical protein